VQLYLIFPELLTVVVVNVVVVVVGTIDKPVQLTTHLLFAALWPSVVSSFLFLGRKQIAT